MNNIDVLLAAFDEAWGHEWESLEAVLGGLTEAEASWQSAAYAGETQEEGWPPEGTILWQLAHLAHCKRYYAAMIGARAEASPPEVEPRTPQEGLAAALGALESAHKEQRAAIVAIGDDDLAAPTCGKMPLGEFLRMGTRHDAWHGAQIAVLRRLYRTRT